MFQSYFFIETTNFDATNGEIVAIILCGESYLNIIFSLFYSPDYDFHVKNHDYKYICIIFHN